MPLGDYDSGIIIQPNPADDEITLPGNVNKVVYGSKVLIDLSFDTVSEDTLLAGKTAHNKSGDAILGKLKVNTFPNPVSSGDCPVVANTQMNRVSTTAYSSSNVKVEIKVAGTYKFQWNAYRSSTSGTNGTQLYKNGTAVGTANTSWTNSYYQYNSLVVDCAVGDTIEVYARARSTSYYVIVGCLVGSIVWDEFPY